MITEEENEVQRRRQRQEGEQNIGPEKDGWQLWSGIGQSHEVSLAKISFRIHILRGNSHMTCGLGLNVRKPLSHYSGNFIGAVRNENLAGLTIDRTTNIATGKGSVLEVGRKRREVGYNSVTYMECLWRTLRWAWWWGVWWGRLQRKHTIIYANKKKRKKGIILCVRLLKVKGHQSVLLLLSTQQEQLPPPITFFY